MFKKLLVNVIILWIEIQFLGHNQKLRIQLQYLLIITYLFLKKVS